MAGHFLTDPDTLSADQLKAAEMVLQGVPFTAVAKKLNISVRTLQRWLKKPAFKAFMDEVHCNARLKTVEKLEKDLSTTLEELANEHLQSHRMVRQMAEKALEVLSGEDLDDINPRTLAVWSQVLARHVEGERQASSLQYLDINKAITIVTQAGYEVIDPSSVKKLPTLENEL